MKTLFAGRIWVLLLILVIAGCVKNDAESPSDKLISYAFWGNPDAIGVEQDIIDTFEAGNPGTRVKAITTPYGDHHTKLLTLIAGGNAPDVMRIDSTYQSGFISALLPLDDLVAKDYKIDPGKYYVAGIESNTINGKLYGLPWATSPLFYFINLGLLREYDIPVPSKEWALDEMYNLIREIYSKSNEEVYGLTLPFTSPQQILPAIWAHNANMVNLDKTKFLYNRSEAVVAIEELVELFQEGVIPRDSIANIADYHASTFISGKVAIIYGSPADMLSLQQTDIEFGIWPSPVGESQNTTMYKSNMIAISKDTKELDAAWEFLAFLRGDPGEKLYMKAQRMPPTIDNPRYWELYADPEKYPKDIIETFTIMNRQSRQLPLIPNGRAVSSLFKSAFEKALLGEIPVQDAMDEITPQINELLNE